LEDYSILFATEPTDRAVVWFIDAMTGFLYDTEDRKVGGLVLTAQLQNGDIKLIAFDDYPKKRKTRVGIKFLMTLKLCVIIQGIEKRRD